MPQKHWQRAIILVDMNAFFASIEQRYHPAWRGLPVAITNGCQGTCIITASYEARAFGIHTGMRLPEARRLCPQLIQCPANPGLYARISATLMKSLEAITPDIEIFSVDEAFLDVTRCQRLWGSPEKMARMTMNTVYRATRLPCSVGLSGDKTTAKFAAKLQKPNGLTVIPPWDARERLRHVPVTELCGIGRRIGDFLAAHNVHLCGDMEKLPISVLARRFGDGGRRIWHMCQGSDPEPLQRHAAAPKSIGHGKIMPPNTRNPRTIRTYLHHMCEKVAARLRRHDMEASRFHAGLRLADGWLKDKYSSAHATHDGRQIMKLCLPLLNRRWCGQGVFQIQVTALDPRPNGLQRDLFEQHGEHDQTRELINDVMDDINLRYGEFTLAPASLLRRSSMPNVIAPAWQPDGPRQSL